MGQKMRLKSILFLLISAFCVYALSAAARTSTQTISKTYTIPKFNVIHFSGHENVVIKKGHVNQINITTDKHVFHDITVAVKNNQLEIHTSRVSHRIGKNVVVNIMITSQSLHFSEIKSKGKLKLIANNITGKQFILKSKGDINAAMSGNISAAQFEMAGNNQIHFSDNHANHISFRTAGNTALYLDGKSDNLSVKSAGNTTIQANAMTVKNLYLIVAGKMIVTARLLKSIHVIGGGNVKVNYYGNPKKIAKTVFGHVSIKNVGQ